MSLRFYLVHQTNRNKCVYIFRSLNHPQIERKRKIGNDLVVIVFKEGGDTPFPPDCICTHFTRILCNIFFANTSQKFLQSCNLKVKSTIGKQTLYSHAVIQFRLAMASKRGVMPFGPFLKQPPIYERSKSFRDFLVIKSMSYLFYYVIL